MSSKVQIQNANLRYLINAAHDAGVAPGTPLTAIDKDGNEVEWVMSYKKIGIQVTFEILDDDDESGDDESGDDQSGDDEFGDVAMTARDKPKLGYGLTPKDTGVCSKFSQYVGIDRAYEEVRYGNQGYEKVGDKWVEPGSPVNDEAIRLKVNKGDWLKKPEFLVDRPVKGEDGKVQKDEDGNAITEKKPLTEVGVKYNCSNLKPNTLCTLLANAVVEPKTPPKPAAKPKTPSAPKKKKTASKTTAPKKKTTKPPSNKDLKKDAGGKCPTGPKSKIQEYILAKCTVAQLKKVHARYYYPVAPRKGGKEPNMGVTAAVLRDELRAVWDM